MQTRTIETERGRQRLALVVMGLAAALAAAAVGAGSARAGETVTFPGSAGDATGYFAVSKREGIRPGLLLVHEWWGLNDDIRARADRFAEEGYAVLAVDLYRGRSTADPNEAHELMRGLPADRADADLRAAYRYVQKHSRVGGMPVGVLGWCMGGGYSLRLAQLEPDLRAAVVYYGRLATTTEALAPIRAPLLGHFGAEDRGIPVDTVRQFETLMKQLGKYAEIHVYDGAGHAFARPGGASYRPEAAKQADARTDQFLRERLGR
jgi:carboxymethylenebutenolidase